MNNLYFKYRESSKISNVYAINYHAFISNLKNGFCNVENSYTFIKITLPKDYVR